MSDKVKVELNFEVYPPLLNRFMFQQSIPAKFYRCFLHTVEIFERRYLLPHQSIPAQIDIKWLSVYGIRMRPGEMLNLKEANINLNIGDSGAFIIPHPKEKKPIIIYLIGEDYNILKEMPRGLPDLYFFRHPKGISGCKAGQKFGNKYLYKWWKRACKELGIENLDLYGGTKHTTVTAANECLTPEQIKQGTGHATNRAFERYFQREARDAVQVYQTMNDLQHTYNQKNSQKNAN